MAGNVIRLELSEASLGGQVLQGRMSPSLASLEHLEYLDLSALVLPGINSSSPKFLGSMTNLRYLDLSGCFLSGSVSPWLGNLSKLEYLDLSFSTLSGRVPPELGNLTRLKHLDLGNMQHMYSADISWITHLRSLEYLDMSLVNLSMVAPGWPHVLNTVPSLEVLNLVKCTLPSTPQALAQLNLTKLVQLDLSSNRLGHPIQSCWFWNLTSIESLELSETFLHGPFPTALGSFTALQWLGFSDNGNAATLLADMRSLCSMKSLGLGGSLSHGNIEDLVDRLPHGITRDKPAQEGNFTSLSYLDLSDNHLAGIIPSDIAYTIPSLCHLDLSRNNLTGPIPIIENSSLSELILRSNQLTGQIPKLDRKIEVMDISINLLSGPFPIDIGSPNLLALILSSNYLIGRIPESVCESQSMIIVDLSNNFLEGAFPKCFQMQRLIFLLLSHNSFSAKLPSFLRNSNLLSYVDLSWNKFSGTLPQWIGHMVNLHFLHLSHNMFYGHIPIKITNLKNLHYFSLAANNISGAIPRCLSKLTMMIGKQSTIIEIDWFHAYFDFVDGSLGRIFSVVMKHQEQQYGDSILDVVGIDLSLNSLTGGIPDEITSLKRLLSLNLSWNQLSGEIVEKIGAMNSLESLDLSRNKFSGEIPPSLANLTYLSYLDLSYNNLTGRIPRGSQLDTLYAENPHIYDGNNGLYGPPLQRNCLGSELPKNSSQIMSKNVSDELMFYFGLGSGFTVGLWVVFCVVLFKKTWRIALFRFFDWIHDKVYVFVAITWASIGREATTD